MSRIEAKLFQVPSVTMDGEAVVFPFKRVDALFYYLLCRKTSTRQELIHLFWEEFAEDVAYKNLRHTIYTLRKCLGSDILLTDKKAEVSLNCQREILCDYDRLEQGQDRTQFLRGFYVKNAPNFNAWIESVRESFSRRQLQDLSAAAMEAFAADDLVQAEKLAQDYLGVDELDEKMVAFLMRVYQRQGQHYKAVKRYQHLKERLAEELGISPLNETTALYYEVVNHWNSMTGEEETGTPPVLIGRSVPLQRLQNLYKEFLESYGHIPALLLCGEPGCGKSYLLQYFLKTTDLSPVQVLVGNCFPAARESHLEAWKGVLLSVAELVLDMNLPLPDPARRVLADVFPYFSDDLDGQREGRRFYRIQCDETLVDAVTLVLSMVAKRRKILLIFEDLQWMDKSSRQLLLQVLRRLNGGLLLLATGRGPDTAVFAARNETLMQRLILPCFTREESTLFCRRQLGEALPVSLDSRIWESTGGNPKLLADLTESLRGRDWSADADVDTATLLKTRLMDLSSEAVGLLDVLSLFEDRAPCGLLSEITGKGAAQLYELYEELHQNALVEEFSAEGESYLCFSHPRMRELVYAGQSFFKRQPMHLNIARHLEPRFRPDSGSISLTLAYHYTAAGERRSALRYQIACLDQYTRRFCTVPPLMTEDPCLRLPEDMEPGEYLRLLEEALRQETSGGSDSRLEQLSRQLSCAKARWLIYKGDYQEGVQLLYNLLEKSVLSDGESLVQVLLPLILYAMQVDQLDHAARRIQQALTLTEQGGMEPQRAWLLLYKGIHACRCGEQDRSEYYLGEAWDLLGQLSAPQPMARAMVWVWRGEGKRYVKDFAGACTAYKQALALVEAEGILPGCGFLYTCYGRATFALEDHRKAETLFRTAVEAYEQTSELSGRALAESYLAYYEAAAGRYEQAVSMLEAAKTSASRLSSLQDQGVRDSVLAQLRRDLDQQRQIPDHALHRYLYRTLDIYCNRGLQRLRGVHGAYEQEQLEQCLYFSIHQARPLTAENLYSKNKKFMTE